MNYEVRERLISKMPNMEADSASIYMGLLVEDACLRGDHLYSTVTDKVYFKNHLLIL